VIGKQEAVLADVLTSDAWKILPYARFSGQVIMPLPPLISSTAMKEQISKACWLLIFTTIFQTQRVLYTSVTDSGLFLPMTDLVLAYTLCRNVFVTYWWFLK